MQQAGGGAAATRAQPYSIYQLQLHGCALLPCCSQKVPRHRQPGKAAANHCHTLRCCLLPVGGGGSGGGRAVQPSWADCVPAQHEWGLITTCGPLQAEGNAGGRSAPAQRPASLARPSGVRNRLHNLSAAGWRQQHWCRKALRGRVFSSSASFCRQAVQTQ